MKSAISKLEAERAEVEEILSSGLFGRSNNPLRLLTFVCEKYFEGALDEIKEYSIAVQALGRPESFDPQVDTIVRVTAHALRKKLEDYYTSAGAEHAVHICLPSGHYVPKFIHTIDLTAAGDAKLDAHQAHRGNGLADDQQVNPAPLSRTKPNKVAKPGDSPPLGIMSPLPIRIVAAAILVISVFVLADFVWKKWQGRSGSQTFVPPPLAAAGSGYTSGNSLRTLAGDAAAAYTDHDGARWIPDQFCSGGSTFSVTGHTIQGTEDGPLFSNGRRGVFHCNYRVQPGTYEVHLLFAETSGLQENSRNVGYSINGGTPYSLDVADDAGGDDIAITKVLTDVVPANDGTIRVDFNTPDAFVNAIEILPAIPHRMLPVRIVAGHSPYHDSSGNVWTSDRYFFGGRLSSFGGDLSSVAEGSLYEWHRFGHFHYVVPVVPGGKYTVRLHFMEQWFGVQNGGIGGVGSRIFDVYCNGSTLLKGFDIFREAGSRPLIKSFQHIEPTAQGKIEIYFMPVVNYPSVSAIEVLQE